WAAGKTASRATCRTMTLLSMQPMRGRHHPNGSLSRAWSSNCAEQVPALSVRPDLARVAAGSSSARMDRDRKERQFPEMAVKQRLFPSATAPVSITAAKPLNLLKLSQEWSLSQCSPEQITSARVGNGRPPLTGLVADA